MSELWESTGAHDRRLARSATGVLAEANAAGILTAADVHIAQTLTRLGGVDDDSVGLAVALAARAVRRGSVGVDLAGLSAVLPEREWPDAGQWLESVMASPLADAGALVHEHGLLYLQRYHAQEVAVCDALLARAAQQPPVVDETALAEGLARFFAGDSWTEQRAAAEAASRSWTTVVTGGPGTGKTTTVAGVLALLAEQHALAGSGRPPRIALAAPTGKAAARLREATSEAVEAFLQRGGLDEAGRERLRAVGDVPASTLHRLLGWLPGGSGRFRHNAGNRLPHDVIVVDEASMVSLSMMRHLLEALRPTTRLILVGDADQLVSVDAGAVLADLVAASDEAIAAGSTPAVEVGRLRVSHRFGAEIGSLATALRSGDADAALEVLHARSREVVHHDGVDPGEVLRPPLLDQALALHAAAEAGDSERVLGVLGRHRLLCAHRSGPHGVRAWNRHVEHWLTESTGDGLYDPMYLGRPLLITANDYAVGVFNGDTGAVVRGEDGRPVAVIEGTSGPAFYAPSRLGDVETMHAMTIHKAQGSQADEITVLLPDEDSPLLTRELLYTAVTRARSLVRVVGSDDVVRAAVERRAVRASGLRARLLSAGG
ncbi:MAG: exodeoxyribonuclease V subunit alpha [Micrococcales bacterium]|nr:exodeoxyribonuclease V subunit alpha [Micrococcales bacterium]